MNVITVKKATKPAGVKRSIRELTRSYFKSERHWNFVIETLLFAIIAAISFWQIVAAADGLNLLLHQRPG